MIRLLKEPLQGFVDSDFVGNIDIRKLLSRYVFTLYRTTISWKAVLQSIVALLTTEAKCMAMIEAVKEAMWLKGIIRDFGIAQKAFTNKCDNKSTFHLVKHQVFHEKSKHIDARLHFVRDMVEKSIISVSKVHTEDNVAYMFTKALPSSKFEHSLSLIKLKTVSSC